MKLNPGWEYILHLTCNKLPNCFGPQKKTPASAGAWILRIDLNTASQFGRPKFVGARRPVIVSRSESASLIIMFVASSDLMFAVRYYKEKKGEGELIFLIELKGGTG